MGATGDIGKFVHAIRAHDLAAVRVMAAAEPALVRQTDPACFGATALIHAVQTDDRAMVDVLLELGADINQRSDWWAGSFGVLDSSGEDMSQHLLARGATLTPHAAARLGMVDRLRAMLEDDALIVRARGGDGQTPLHFAQTVEIAELLLSRGADIDALDIDHASTPAQWLGESRPDVARHLVSRGAAPDPFLAARIGDTALLAELVPAEPRGLDVRVTRERFVAAPPAAGHIYLYSIGEGCSLLHSAAAVNQCASIRWLAETGADVNARGGYDQATPLHVAAWGDKAEATEALLNAGADIDLISGAMHRNGPIGWAIVGGSVNTFRILLERGARLLEHHFSDARKGAEGAFREFNPRRPLSNWGQIADTLKALRGGAA
ncbi:MAG: ankyrin repeat domain-containing protein [Pyrinomonadaceae bacterium]|nr:ankyrin repeat domain-containing protein [Phycisphaerales bacterium]